MRVTDEIRAFTNPAGRLQLEAPFSIELRDDRDIPTRRREFDWVTYDGHVTHVNRGELTQDGGACTVRHGGEQFYHGNDTIFVIRDGDGNLIWVNYNCTRERST